MGLVTNRTGLTSQAFCSLSPWIQSEHIYSIGQINLGSNPNSKLEIVSSLNFFNLAYDQYHFNYANCIQKYNPKVYLGTVQTTSYAWNYDYDSTRKNLAQGLEKSGS